MPPRLQLEFDVRESTLITERQTPEKSMYKIVTFTPRELFDKVWETPVLKQAQEIGISDVALSKACRKAGLALPPQGHWTKPVSKRPSKPVPPTDERPIRFTVLDRSTLPVRSTVPAQPKVVRSAIEVPHTLLAPHSLVTKWMKCVNAAKRHEGYLVTTGKNVLDAKIFIGLIDRCALIFDALIKENEQSQRLRAFIQATCDANTDTDTSEQTQQKTALWAAWATSQANLLDPLHPNTSSVTSLTMDIKSWFNGYGMTRTEKDWWSE